MAITIKSAVKSTKRSTAKKPKSRIGTSKLAPQRGFKLWMAALVVVLVATAGYAIVNFSEASSYAFHRSGRNIIGGATVPNNKKDGSQGYSKYIQSGNFVFVEPSKSRLSGSKSVCVQFVPQSDYTRVTIEINNTGSKGSKVARRGPHAIPNFACVAAKLGKPYKAQNFVRVSAEAGNAYIQKIYGTK